MFRQEKKITKKQKKVLDFIARYYQDHRVYPTQKEIKDHFGFKSFGSVQCYLKYLANAGFLESHWNARRGLRIKKLGDLSPNYFSRSSFPSSSFSSFSFSSPSPIPFKHIPLLGRVAAGVPLLAEENHSDTLAVSSQMLRGPGPHFALTVWGDSMILSGIYSGDTAIIQKTSQALAGQIVVAILGDEATLKRFYPASDQGNPQIELRPSHPTLSSIFVRPEDVQIKGTLVGLLRSYC